MKPAIKKGFSFGLASGVITTLGLMVGLYASTHSLLAVLGGILVIAVADALSDALGIHISEEAESKKSVKENHFYRLQEKDNKQIYCWRNVITIIC